METDPREGRPARQESALPSVADEEVERPSIDRYLHGAVAPVDDSQVTRQTKRRQYLALHDVGRPGVSALPETVADARSVADPRVQGPAFGIGQDDPRSAVRNHEDCGQILGRRVAGDAEEKRGARAETNELTKDLDHGLPP